MILPIIDSILHGSLRPVQLKDSLSEKQQLLLTRKIRHACENSTHRAIESELIDSLQDVVPIKTSYERDKELLESIDAKQFADNHYSPVSEVKWVKCVVPQPPLTTPTLRLYQALLDAEVRRTVIFMIDLSRHARNDEYMRYKVIAMIKRIESYCHDTKLQMDSYESEMQLAGIKLTELDFSLQSIFAAVLNAFQGTDYLDSPESLIYLWNKKYPETVGEQEKQQAKEENVEAYFPEKEEPDDDVPQKKALPSLQKDKVDRFFENASEFNLFELLKKKRITDPVKRKELFRWGLQSNARACALLKVLEFFTWIKDSQKPGYKIGEFDAWCSENIMGEPKGSQAFKHVRATLKPNAKEKLKEKACDFLEEAHNRCEKAMT